MGRGSRAVAARHEQLQAENSAPVQPLGHFSHDRFLVSRIHGPDPIAVSASQRVDVLLHERSPS